MACLRAFPKSLIDTFIHTRVLLTFFAVARLQGCPPWDSDRKHLWLNMRRITKNEFVALLPLAAPDRQAVKQHVRNFVWKVIVVV